ncbi:MAG: hypothetical protein IH797_04420, partial [Chloroflexi bacterium]|nr:hypothetical protein [Chloroflexota bacterium]
MTTIQEAYRRLHPRSARLHQEAVKTFPSVLLELPIGLTSTSRRIESPSGSVTLTPTPSTILANGTSTSAIASDVITDALGNTVRDGTRFTATATAGTIVTADADLILAGLQVTTVAGRLSLDLQSSTAPTTASVTVRAITGASSGSIDVGFVADVP